MRPALHRVRSNNQTFAQPLPLRASSLLPLCRRPGHYHKSRTGPGAISGGEQRPKSAGLRFELLCTPNARGGFSPKIHLRTNAKGDPLIFDVTSGEAHEVKGYDALMRLHEADPSKLLGDKGYDSDDIRRDLIDRGIEPIIPPTNDATSSSDARITSIAGPNPRNGTSLEYPTFYRTAQIDGLSIQRGRPKRRADASPAARNSLFIGMFEPLFARIADRYHLVAPDYPGFGHSDGPDPNKFTYTFDHYAEIMNHFTEALGIQKCTMGRI